MKKAAITGVRQAALIDVATPKAVADWVLVKVCAAPMCTEYKSFIDGTPSAFLGHEAAGEVVEVAHHGPVKPGDRVVVMPVQACGRCELCVAGDYIHCESTRSVLQETGQPEGDATYAQYLLKPGWQLPKIPDDVSYEHAALACCGLGPSFGAFSLMNLTAFDTVLITGLGPVGLGAVVNARFRGARVIAVDVAGYRADYALSLGAEAVVDPRDPDAARRIRELCGGRGPDCALDCSGVVAAHRLCIDAVRRKGQVAFVGECWDNTALCVSDDMIRKGLRLIGSWHYNLNLFPQLMHVIRHSPLVDRLISHRLPMSGVQQALALSATPAHAKIVLDPWR
jgi:L-iditol 2-dehydrogenase